MAIKLGSRVREIPAPPPPDATVVALNVDKDSLDADPENPVVIATIEWETPEEEKGMGPVVHQRSVPLSGLEERK